MHAVTSKAKLQLIPWRDNSLLPYRSPEYEFSKKKFFFSSCHERKIKKKFSVPMSVGCSGFKFYAPILSTTEPHRLYTVGQSIPREAGS